MAGVVREFMDEVLRIGQLALYQAEQETVIERNQVEKQQERQERAEKDQNRITVERFLGVLGVEHGFSLWVMGNVTPGQVLW
jgi:hypothetical protein